MAYECILLNVENGVATLTLNRPASLNSMNITLLRETRAAVREAQANPESRVLVITGAGRGFCSGADLSAHDDAMPAGLSPGQRTYRRMDEYFNPMIREIYECNLPVITAVNGVAAGGGMGLALTGDIVIAARSAKFVQVFTKQLGIIPDLGSSWHLPRLVGRARAMGLAFLGDALPAEQAEEWGLIWKCVDDEKLMEEVGAIAARLVEGPTSAYREVRSALAHGEHSTLPRQLDYERDVQGVLCDGADFAEGVVAFMQKRKPVFKRK